MEQFQSHHTWNFTIFFQELIVEKGPGEKLGMSIKGGVKSYAANPKDRTDEGIFISRVGNIYSAYTCRSNINCPLF